MNSSMIGLLLAAILASFSATACSAEPDGAREFVDAVIAREGGAQNDNPIPEIMPFLTQRFRLAIERGGTGEDGEMGWLDHDPLCMCQDPDGMEYEIISIDGNEYAATATISVGANRAHWYLIHLSGGWKLADISEHLGGGDEEVPSVLRALEVWAGPAEKDQDLPYVECMPTSEECSFLQLDSETDPNRQLIYYICGTDRSTGSVDRYSLRGVEGLAAVNCWTEKNKNNELVWLLEIEPRLFSVWKRELRDGEYSWDIGLPNATRFDEEVAILSAEAECSARQPGWRGKWVWLANRFERLEYSEQPCVEWNELPASEAAQ